MLSSVNEAFMNAVDHGNKGDISKIVTFDHRILAEGKIVLTISDEGNGFNWKHAGGLPTDPEQEGGRGLFIIEHFSEKYCFNKKGNRIEFHFTFCVQKQYHQSKERSV